jgi:hypothetical protein
MWGHPSCRQPNKANTASNTQKRHCVRRGGKEPWTMSYHAQAFPGTVFVLTIEGSRLMLWIEFLGGVVAVNSQRYCAAHGKVRTNCKAGKRARWAVERKNRLGNVGITSLPSSSIIPPPPPLQPEPQPHTTHLRSSISLNTSPLTPRKPFLFGHHPITSPQKKTTPTKCR